MTSSDTTNLVQSTENKNSKEELCPFALEAETKSGTSIVIKPELECSEIKTIVPNVGTIVPDDKKSMNLCHISENCSNPSPQSDTNISSHAKYNKLSNTEENGSSTPEILQDNSSTSSSMDEVNSMNLSSSQDKASTSNEKGTADKLQHNNQRFQSTVKLDMISAKNPDMSKCSIFLILYIYFYKEN